MKAFILALTTLTALPACMPEAVAPPLRPMTLAPPTVLARGETGITGQVAVRAMTAESPLDSWTVAARHGFGADVEGTLDATYLHETSSIRDAATSSGMAVRAGVRYAVPARTHVVVFAAAGGGPYDGGTLLGGDMGVTVGSGVFFFTARLSISGVVGAKVIDDGDWVPACFILCDQTPTDERNAPHAMATLETMLGFRAPFKDGSKSSFVFGFEIVQSGTAAAYHVGAGLGTGIEIVF